MKALQRNSIVLLIITLSVSNSFAQTEQDSMQVIHKIIKQNGASFVGTIISKDPRELLLQTDNVGLVYIPKHEIEEIIEIKEDEEIESGGLFSTRYFLTTNGFNIKKGENYVQWNIFGPDFQFGVADNFTMGIMTSWVGMPIIGTAKYSGKIAKNTFGGLGFLGGTGSWAFPQYGLALPFGFISAGDRINNVNFTTGYGFLFTEQEETSYTIIPAEYPEYETNSVREDTRTYNDAEGRILLSVAGMFRINDKFSFVFDSFIMLAGKDKTRQTVHQSYNQVTMLYTNSIVTETIESNPLAVFVPGIRFQATQTSSFQFGFTGIHFDGEFLPVPVPMIQWFKRI